LLSEEYVLISLVLSIFMAVPFILSRPLGFASDC
jgi:hypothetical protein